METRSKHDGDMRIANKVWFLDLDAVYTGVLCGNSSSYKIMIRALLKMRFNAWSSYCSAWNLINGSQYYFHHADTNHLMCTCGLRCPHRPFTNPFTRGRNPNWILGSYFIVDKVATDMNSWHTNASVQTNWLWVPTQRQSWTTMSVIQYFSKFVRMKDGCQHNLKGNSPPQALGVLCSDGCFLFYFPPSLFIPENLWFKPTGYWPPGKDTKTLIGYFKVPEVNPQVISWHVGLIVAVDWYRVDVICVCVGKYSSRGGLHHQVHGSQDRHLGWKRNKSLQNQSSSPGKKCAWLCPSSSHTKS